MVFLFACSVNATGISGELILHSISFPLTVILNIIGAEQFLVNQHFIRLIFYSSIIVIAVFILISVLYIKRNKEKKRCIDKLQQSLNEKEKTSLELKFSEGKYFSLIRVLNEGFMYTDTNDRILFLNEKAYLIFGGIFDDLINRNIYDFFPAKGDVKIYNEKKELRKRGIADQYELQIKKVGGEQIWVNLSASPLLDENNNWIGSVGIISDVTERKKYDKSMKELTANLNQKIKQLNCLYDISDLTGVPGITFEEIFIRSLDIIPFGFKYSHDTCVEIIFENQVFRSDNFKETQRSYIIPIKVQKKKLGHIKVCYTEEKPFINKDPFHFNEKILIKNIAEKLGQVIETKNMENALKESKHKLNLAQKVAKIGNWEWDVFNDRKIFSDSFFDLLDIPIEKRYFFDDEMFFKMIHPDDKKRLQGIFNKISKNDFSTLEFESKIIKYNGIVKNVLFNGDIIKDSNNQPVKLIFAIQDTTGQVKINKAKKSITGDYE